MNRYTFKECLIEYGPLTLILLAFLVVLLLSSGCGTTNAIKDAKGPIDSIIAATVGEGNAQQDPFLSAAVGMTRIGVLLIAGGLVFGAFTKFSSGWGLSAAAAGVLMILLAWTFRQPWLPWMGLLTILAYAGYKVYNRLNPEVATEALHE